MGESALGNGIPIVQQKGAILPLRVEGGCSDLFERRMGVRMTGRWVVNVRSEYH